MVATAGQERCLELTICHGVEYRVGHCELWTRPEGIGATAQRRGQCVASGLTAFCSMQEQLGMPAAAQRDPGAIGGCITAHEVCCPLHAMVSWGEDAG